MRVFSNKIWIRYIFVAVAITIAIGSLIISNHLAKQLSTEERSKIKIWAEGTKAAASSNEDASVNLIVQILESNKTIPVILFDKKDGYYTSANIDLPRDGEQGFLEEKAKSFEKRHEPIVIEFDDFEQYVYYDDSYTLKHLQIFPYIQLGVMAIFVITAMMAILSTKRMEQDRLWVGLTKETAHQLGTPISSLMAWLEYLRMKGGADNSIVDDMEKDVNRLQVITDRFSKVGSTPALERKDVAEVVLSSIKYLGTRISKKVTININIPDQRFYATISESLVAWVIENLIKNAVDAMSGQGHIEVSISKKDSLIHIDIQDTGKGITKSKFKEVFTPGYTTKSRGWGLGLSLAKRIIESYHNGKIYVKASELNIGTTFRISLTEYKE